MQGVNHQDLARNVLSPEAKEFVPRNFPGTRADVAGNGDGCDRFLRVGDSSMLDQRAVASMPQYMTTCYPFVPASGDARFPRPRYRGKSPQMFMQSQYSLHQGSPRNRFPHPGKNFMATPSWGPAVSDIRSSFPNVPNGMPFDGGTSYQNGFPPNLSMQHVLNIPQQYQTAYGGNGFIKEKEAISGTPVNGLTGNWNFKTYNGVQDDDVPQKIGEIRFKTSAVQTDFPAQLANATLEEKPNSLFKKNNRNKTTSHQSRSKQQPHLGKLTSLENSKSDNSQDHHYGNNKHRTNCVSNGTDPVTDGFSASCENNLNSMQYPSSVISNNVAMFNGINPSDSVNSGLSSKPMQKSPMQVPYSVSDSLVSQPASILSYAAVAQSKPSHALKQKIGENISKIPMATGDTKQQQPSNTSVVSNSGNVTKKTPKGGGAGSRLVGVDLNVADLMADLERADTLRSGQTGDQKSFSASNQVSNQGNSHSSAGGSGSTSQLHIGAAAGGFNYSAIVKKSNNSQVSANDNLHKPGSYPGSRVAIATGSFVSEGQPGAKQQNFQSGSTVKNNKGGGLGSSVQQTSHNQSLTHNKIHGSYQGEAVHGVNMATTDDPGEGDGIKKRRRRRRRRRKKNGGEDGGSGGSGEEEITLHFEDAEEFPDLASAASTNQNGPSSSGSGTVFSYSAALKNTGPVSNTWSDNTSFEQVQQEQEQQQQQQPTGSLLDEYLDKDALISPDSSGTKETRTSRKRRKRREVANKAADAEMAEINLEQQMLEQKMKQRLPLTAKKSVSPQRTGSTQGVWKLPPTSPTPPSSSGKKVSLLLPGTVATETSHASLPTTTSTVTKQHGILKTSMPVTQSNQGGKKSKQPITYDLGALIDALETKKEVPAQPKKSVKPVVVKKDDSKSHNILDSSAPVKRGKEREVPKCKKPSPLKKVILKEREEKKRLRLLDDDETTPGAPVGIGVLCGDSDLSQDASSSKGSMEVGLGTPASAELSPISQQSPSCMSPMSPGTSPISSGLNSPITGTISQTVKLKIHSRRFREYCNQVLDKEIDNSVTALLTDLVRFQDKQYHKDPVKAKSKRRFVLGLREVTKHLKLKKIKCVIISPNLEKIQSKGGLDDALNQILDLCTDQSVPFIFALGRRALGRACAKLVPVSVVGIFNYEGSEVNFRNLVALTEKAREAYREMITQIEKEIAEYPIRNSAPGIPTLFSHMGHSRTPSGCSVISFTSSILSEPISENYPQSEPETDNRGYEIERKTDDVDDVDIDVADLKEVTPERLDGDEEEEDGMEEGVSDPYEADDESNIGRLGTKKAGKLGKVGKTSRVGWEKKVGSREGGADEDGMKDGATLSGVVNDVSNCDLDINGSCVNCGCDKLRNQTCSKCDPIKASKGADLADGSGPPGDYLCISNGTRLGKAYSASGVTSSKNDSRCHSGSETKGDNLDKAGGFHDISSGEEDFEEVEDEEEEDEEENCDKGFNDRNEDGEKDVSRNFCSDDDDDAEDDDDDGDDDDSEEDDSEEGEEDDEDHNDENVDQLVDLPQFIESVHHFDLTEILSQHSSKTIENGEDVMSTHSSRTTHSSKTLGDAAAASIERQSGKAMEMKNSEYTNAGTLKGKTCIDKENRTLSWVKEAQNIRFSDEDEQDDELDSLENNDVSEK